MTASNSGDPPPLRRDKVPPMAPSAWGDERGRRSPPGATQPNALGESDYFPQGPPPQSYNPSSLSFASPETRQSASLTISHEEFIHTYAMIQFVAQPALVNVVRALLDEHPWLTTQVRLLCDQSMQQLIAMTAAQQQHQSAGLGHPSTPPSWYASASTTARRPSTTTAAAGGGGGNRRPLHRDEDYDLCAVHNNWRPVKHLHYNATARHVECIPGFHCLETHSSASSAPTPTKRQLGEATPPSTFEPLRVADWRRKSEPRTPPHGAPFLNPHTPPPEPAENQRSPTDPDETRRLEALLSELHKTTHS